MLAASDCLYQNNFLYLSHLLVNSTKAERAIILSMLPRTSPVTWKHINFQGEFNFDDDLSRDPVEASLSDIISYEPEGVESV